MIKRFLGLFLESSRYESFRYLIIGGSCSLGHLLFLKILTDYFGVYYLLSVVISFILISMFGYFGQKYFTYRNFEKRHGFQLSVYWIMIGIGLALDLALMYLLVSIIGVYYLLAAVITRFIILVINFLCGKYITFKKFEVDQDLAAKQTMLEP